MCWVSTCPSWQGSHRREHPHSVGDWEVSDDDENIFLSANVEGGIDGLMTTGEALHRQKLAQGSVGKSTNPEKEQLALVDDGSNNKEILGGRDRRCEIGELGSEGPESLMILSGRRGQRKTSGRS